jgi:hypothetical protein
MHAAPLHTGEYQLPSSQLDHSNTRRLFASQAALWADACAAFEEAGQPEAALRVHYGRKDLQAAGQLLVSWQQQGSLPPGQLLALRKAHVLKLAHHCHVTRDKEGFIRAVQMHPDAGVRRR